MKLKLLILSLSFLLISCGGPPSENSKTTIMDVVKYLEQVEWKDFSKWRSKELGMSEEEYLNFMSKNGVELPNFDEKPCGKFERYEPKIASMVGAIEGGTIYMSEVSQKENTLKEKTLNLSYSEFISQVREGQIESVLINSDGKTISATYKNGNTFSTYGLNDSKLLDDLLANNIDILTEPPPPRHIFCEIGVYKYSDESAAILNVKSDLLKNGRCIAKGYFVFCGISSTLMHDF